MFLSLISIVSLFKECSLFISGGGGGGGGGAGEWVGSAKKFGIPLRGEQKGFFAW